MPEDDKFQKRDKALFAFFMLTGARVGAAVTLMLKHVNLFDGHIFQDAREVATKNAKTIDTWFFPIDLRLPRVLRGVGQASARGRALLRYGPAFSEGEDRGPKRQVRESGACTRGIFGWRQVQRHYPAGLRPSAHLPEFTPHAFRKTLALYCDQISRTREEFKALSMNLGHEHVATTVDSYIPMSRERQGELVRGLNTRK
jgi:integrase/recombinase XerD